MGIIILIERSNGLALRTDLLCVDLPLHKNPQIFGEEAGTLLVALLMSA